jgi:hypothetical protein
VSLLLPLGMAASLPSFHKVAVSLPCYIQVPLSGLAGPLLKSVQDVHRFRESGYVEQPVGCPGLNSNLSDTRTNGGHGFPITRLKPLLEAEQLEPGHPASAGRERPDVSTRRPKPEERLFHQPSLYKILYTGSKAPRVSFIIIDPGRDSRATAAVGQERESWSTREKGWRESWPADSRC